MGLIAKTTEEAKSNFAWALVYVFTTSLMVAAKLYDIVGLNRRGALVGAQRYVFLGLMSFLLGLSVFSAWGNWRRYRMGERVS